jgi:hypothetical protein
LDTGTAEAQVHQETHHHTSLQLVPGWVSLLVTGLAAQVMGWV